MSLVETYAPPRDIAAKLRRRLTQYTRARPALLRFDTPILSVCFDDFPQSAAFEGARILESHGGRGTFYASAGLAQVEGACGPGFASADLARLAAAGHEIACHTFAHRDCARLDAFKTLIDLAKNRDALAAMGHAAPLQALAYPYGETSTDLKASLPPRYRSARGILPGLNVGRVDLAQLRAFPLFGQDFDRARSSLKRAARRRAWMIVFTHDVSPTPSPWGTRAKDLDAFLVQARGLGFQLLSVTPALAMARP